MSDIQNLPKHQKQKAKLERNYFNAVVRQAVQETNIRSVKGPNYQVVLSKSLSDIQKDEEVLLHIKRTVIRFIAYKKKIERSSGDITSRYAPRKLYPTELLDYNEDITNAVLGDGTEVCLLDKVVPVAKAKIIQHPAIEPGLTEDQQQAFASVQILLKKRNTEVAFMPYNGDFREWKDIVKGTKIALSCKDITPIEMYEQIDSVEPVVVSFLQNTGKTLIKKWPESEEDISEVLEEEEMARIRGHQ